MLCNISRASAHSSRTFCLRTFCLHLSALHKGIAQLSAPRVIPPRKLTIFQYLRRHLRPSTPPFILSSKQFSYLAAPLHPPRRPLYSAHCSLLTDFVYNPCPCLFPCSVPSTSAATAKSRWMLCAPFTLRLNSVIRKPTCKAETSSSKPANANWMWLPSASNLASKRTSPAAPTSFFVLRPNFAVSWPEIRSQSGPTLSPANFLSPSLSVIPAMRRANLSKNKNSLPKSCTSRV